MKILLAQLPLEVHSRGMNSVAKLLRDAGHEVIVLGNATTMQILKSALDENVDAIGISAYCGGELERCEFIGDWCDRNWPGVKLMVGGCIGEPDKLEAAGFAVFETGCNPASILSYLDKP